MTFRNGQVIWAAVKDRNGFEKNRPLVILNPNDEIEPHLPLVCAAISTRFKLPLKLTEILLPWAQHGRSVSSGLWEPCVAVLDWICQVEQADVKRIVGLLPDVAMRAIQKRLHELDSNND